MIHSKDRSFYIGASDTKFVMGNYKTATFDRWWRQKLGLNKDRFETEAMKVGTNLEHKILKYIGCQEMDKQIIVEHLNLRVNYDGTDTDKNKIFEVKTTKGVFKLSKDYIGQAQVEMLAWRIQYGVVPELKIVAYTVDDNDYKNFFAPIDPERLKEYKVEFDEDFCIEYINKLNYLAECIREGRAPNA